MIGLRGSWGLSHISKPVLRYSNRGQASPTEGTDVQRSFAQRLALASVHLHSVEDVYTNVQKQNRSKQSVCTESVSK